MIEHMAWFMLGMGLTAMVIFGLLGLVIHEGKLGRFVQALMYGGVIVAMVSGVVLIPLV